MKLDISAVGFSTVNGSIGSACRRLQACAACGVIVVGGVAMAGDSSAQETTVASPEEAAPAANTVFSGRELLAEADRLYNGSEGKTDQLTSADLYRRAAATGDPLANLQLARMIHHRRIGHVQDRQRAQQLVESFLDEGLVLAKSGDRNAQTVVGALLSQSIGVHSRESEGHELLARAARSGDAEAMQVLGYLHAAGDGVEADPEAAERWLTAAAEAGDCGARNELGRRLLWGLGLSKDAVRGNQALGVAVRCNYPQAKYDLGWHLIYDRGDDGSIRRGVSLLEEALADGVAAAGVELGAIHRDGEKAKVDLDRSRRALEAAVGLGSADALNSLGWAYHKGLGVEADAGRAADLYAQAIIEGEQRALNNLLALRAVSSAEFRRVCNGALLKAAEAGITPAQSAVAHYNFDWLVGGSESKERAFRFATVAAEKGDVAAMWVLGRAYDKGEGTVRDSRKAIDWLTRGAELGQPGCMLRLGHLYFVGRGVEKSQELGLQWTEKAAEQRWLPAVDRLAEIYDKSFFGVPRDVDKAVEWYRVAAELGNVEAQGRLRYLELTGKP